MLSKEKYKELIKTGILVGFDLVGMNEKDEVLVGKRQNAPAKGFYFVPGGRMYKDETFKEAISRLSMSELGYDISMLEKELLGVYEHIYAKENFFNLSEVSTHYIIMAFKFRINSSIFSNLDLSDQHSNYKLMSKSELLGSEEVHQFTKNYFLEYPPNRL